QVPVLLERPRHLRDQTVGHDLVHHVLVVAVPGRLAAAVQPAPVEVAVAVGVAQLGAGRLHHLVDVVEKLQVTGEAEHVQGGGDVDVDGAADLVDVATAGRAHDVGVLAAVVQGGQEAVVPDTGLRRQRVRLEGGVADHLEVAADRRDGVGRLGVGGFRVAGLGGGGLGIGRFRVGRFRLGGLGVARFGVGGGAGLYGLGLHDDREGVGAGEVIVGGAELQDVGAAGREVGGGRALVGVGERDAAGAAHDGPGEVQAAGGQAVVGGHAA